MAVYNEILAGRFNRAVQKLFGIKGPPPTPQLASEIIPVHPFASGAEHRFLEQWDQFANSAAIAAVAAQFGTVQLRNPFTSGCIAVVFKAFIATTSAADIPILTKSDVQTADLATVTRVSSIDTRSGNIQSAPKASACVYSAATLGAAGGFTQVFWASLVSAASNYYDIISDAVQEIVLLPGSSLRLSTGLANNQIAAGFWWRERALEESEKF